MARQAKKPAAKKGPKTTIKDVQGCLDTVVKNTDLALGEIRMQMAEQAKANEAIFEFLKKQSTNAIDNPVVLSKTFEAAEKDLGGVEDIGDSPIVTGLFDINSKEFADKAHIEAFMHEKVKVHIHELNHDLEVEMFEVSVNNNEETFRFGETKVVPRYIVEQLARAKPAHYSNKEIVNKDGVRVVINPGTRGLRYPFSVVEDANPVGRSWLSLVFAQS